VGHKRAALGALVVVAGLAQPFSGEEGGEEWAAGGLGIEELLPVVYADSACSPLEGQLLPGAPQGQRNAICEVETAVDLLALAALYLVEQVEAEDRLDGC
jgi:hypothetical protein